MPHIQLISLEITDVSYAVPNIYESFINIAGHLFLICIIAIRYADLSPS